MSIMTTKMTSLLLVLTYITVANYAEAANILIIIPFSSKSHYIMLRPIGLEMAKRGHNITVITAIKEPNPPANYHEVLVEYKEIWDVMGTKRPVVFDMIHKTFREFLNDVLWTGGLAFTEVALNSSNFQEFLKADNSYDLIFNEQFFQESFNVLAHKYNAPLVVASTLGNCMKHNFVIGNPLQLNTIIFEILTIRDHTSIWDRLRNVYATVYEYVWWKYWYLGKQETLVQKYITDLKDPVPSLFEMQKYISLLFINTHFSFDTPIALLPNVIEIGGIHTSQKNNMSLPQDLQNILDNATDGVVYMNFGSNVRISEMDEIKKTAIFNVFRSLNQTVLMKWEVDILENIPDNVIARKWFPQRDLFAHPKIRVFISHGGLIGTQEAIFHGVPILGVPIYADQYNNLDLANKHGFGKIVEFHNICEKTFGEALNEMLANKTYKENAEKMSKRFKDRPMSPLDTTIWWMEYVIRNNGAHFMKSPTINMGWFKYFMLDIYLVVLTAVIIFIYFVIASYKIVRFLSKFIRSKVRIVKKKRL